jgi:hypothetical protein
MDDHGRITLNALNYDAGRQTVDFSFQGAYGGAVASITGAVPLVMLGDGDARQTAKDAVRQLLMEAIEAL